MEEEDMLGQLKSPLLGSNHSSGLSSLASDKANGAPDYEEDEISLDSALEHDETRKFDQFEASFQNLGAKKQASFRMNGKKEEPAVQVAITGMNLLTDKISRVEKSWLIISERGKIPKVGEKFFLKMFDEHPDLVQLFPFGEDSIDRKTGKLKLNARTRRHIQAHASAVMRVVGTCVAGLTSIEELVPRLRNVGATHKIVGVQSMHYDILYRHLISAIREEVGKDWDVETENAWEQAYLSITDLIKRPSKRLETEPLQGWGVVMLLACLYFTLVTPIRFAGFFIGRQTVIFLLDVLDTLAASCLALDFMIDFIQTKLRLKKQFVADMKDEESIGSRSSKLSKTSRTSGRSRMSWVQQRKKTLRAKMLNLLIKRRRGIIKRLHRWNMDRWMPWPALDAKVVLSFVLQGLFVRGSLCSIPGLHWTQLFGLLRLSCASRVLHFVQCAENNALLGQKLDADRQLALRVIKLLVRLAFITHVSACMWCTVARVGLGVDAKEFTASAFFPNPEILSHAKGRNVFNSYSRAIHWAFVNLSGIGGVESVPETSLECWTVLVVHMIGAIFYAIVTGSVITVLEESAQNENKIGAEISKLSSYLNTARVSAGSKERIMKGYMMRNVLTDGKDASGPVLDGLQNGDEVLETLPGYLRAEVGIYARAEIIRRRVSFFTHCSNGFLVALSGSLSRTRLLLPGDYLIKKGERYDTEFMVIESGTLQVRKDGHTIKTMERGECIGKSWLLQEQGVRSKTLGLKEDGTTTVSIRAMTPCVIMTGLQTKEEVQKLEHAYAVDFKLLRAEAKGHRISENERQTIAMRGIAKAVRRFKARKLARKRAEEAAARTEEGLSPVADESETPSDINVSEDDLLRIISDDS